MFVSAGSSLAQHPAAGPFSQLLCKNINVPVYTTLKGVSDSYTVPLHPFFIFVD